MNIKRTSLKNFSSLRIGGEGDLVIVHSTIELVEALMYAKKEALQVCVLGSGTNTYFGESLSHILFLKIEIKGISFEEQEEDVYINAQAGEVWDDLVKFACSKNLWGIENLSYIPGTVGAAPVQNIGAYGVELKDTLISLSALDTRTLNVVEISNSACQFGYRDSLFKHEVGRYIIISITLKLSKKRVPILTYKPLDLLVVEENLKLEDVRNLVVKTRQAKLPDWIAHPNAGSFFKNPVVTSTEAEGLRAKYPEIPLIPHQEGYKIPAAWLIEHIADMKGIRVGDVGTWPNQPLVIVNYGNATAKELVFFVTQITKKIKDKTNISLDQEVNFFHNRFAFVLFMWYYTYLTQSSVFSF